MPICLRRPADDTRIVSLIIAIAVLLSPLAAQAGVITTAISATASSENFDAQGIGYTIDQSGLFTTYVSGVTDFDTYIATNPLHTTTANETAWYSARYDTDNAFVIYDMGSPLELLRLALWNDEYSGFGQAIISSSLDGVNFSPLTTINPVDSPWGFPYGPQVFDLGVTAQFLRFDLSGCPQPNGTPTTFTEYCGIGEVAFDVGSTSEPISVAYDISASNFSDGLFDGTPPPLEGFAGSFGFTFEATTGGLIVYETVPDFVSLSILSTDYTVNNTAIQVNDGDVIAITFGGLPNGPASASKFTNDFYLTFFISDVGDVLPGLIGASVVCRQDQSDCWIAVPADVSVIRRPLDPGALLEQLGTTVTGVGSGNSLADKIMLAQTYLAIPDVQSACGILNAFVNQVRAQRGKKLSVEQADQFTADAEAIQAAIGCD